MKRRIKLNAWGNWKAYEGTRGVYDFGTNEQGAKDWANGGDLPKFNRNIFINKIGKGNEVNNVTIDSITTISGSAGGSTGEADVTIRVKGRALTVEAVRQYVEQAVITPATAKRRERVWGAALSIENAKQADIAVGDIVRAYDFPGSRDDVYAEGVVKTLESDRVLIHVTREVWKGEAVQVDRFEIWSPLGVSSLSSAPCVFLLAKRVERS
jgi:hypothetical protein